MAELPKSPETCPLKSKAIEEILRKLDEAEKLRPQRPGDDEEDE